MVWTLETGLATVAASISLLSLVVNIFLYRASSSQAAAARDANRQAEKSANTAEGHRLEAARSADRLEEVVAALNESAEVYRRLAEAEEQKAAARTREEISQGLRGYDTARGVFRDGTSSDPDALSNQRAVYVAWLDSFGALPEPVRSVAVAMLAGELVGYGTRLTDWVSEEQARTPGLYRNIRRFVADCQEWAREKSENRPS